MSTAHQQNIDSLVSGLELPGYDYHQAFISAGTKTLYVVPNPGMRGYAFNEKDVMRAQISQVDRLILAHLVPDGPTALKLKIVLEADFGMHVWPLVERHSKLWRGNCKIVLERELPAFLEELRQ